MSGSRQWQDWANVIVGAGLVYAPFYFGHSTHPAAAVAYVAGGLLIVMGLWEIVQPARSTGEWVEAVVGVILLGSPWALIAAGLMVAWSGWIAGLLALLLALSALCVREAHHREQPNAGLEKSTLGGAG